jgi:serine/threonine protein kinase
VFRTKRTSNVGSVPIGTERITVAAEGAPASAAVSGQSTRVSSERSGTPFDSVERRFHELRELGRGGMGRVFEASDAVLERTVAIKQTLTGSSDVRRFAREARVNAKLEHPGIVPVYEAGRQSDGTAFYVMRKINGRSLEELSAGASTIGDRLALLPAFIAAADAAAYAHSKAIIHRDIKPNNILTGDFGETLLIDWGLARELGSSDDESEELLRSSYTSAQATTLTNVGAVFGTPGFISPEQARGDKVDARSDVYSLGATLYFLLTARCLFQEATSSQHMISLAAAGAEPALIAFAPEVSPVLITILKKAIHVESALRYQNAGELAEDLRRFLSGRLITSHRYSASQRLSRFVRRFRTAIVAAMLAFLAVLIVGGGAIVSVVRQRDRATAAESATKDLFERMLVERSASQVKTNPTLAIATLKQLSSTSQYWQKAKLTALEAKFSGTTNGIAVAQERINALAINQTQTRIASTSLDGTLYIHDLLSNRSQQVLRTTESLYCPSWIGDRIIYCSKLGVHIVDADGGNPRLLMAIANIDTVIIGADHKTIYVKNNDKTASAVTVDGAVRNLVEGAERVEISNTETVAFIKQRSLEVPNHKFSLPIGNDKDLPLIALSPDGKRVAFATQTSVTEIELDGPTQPTQTWELSAPWSLEYSGSRLFVSNSLGTHVLGNSGLQTIGNRTYNVVDLGSRYLLRPSDQLKIWDPINGVTDIGPVGTGSIQAIAAGDNFVAFAGDNTIAYLRPDEVLPIAKSLGNCSVAGITKGKMYEWCENRTLFATDIGPRNAGTRDESRHLVFALQTQDPHSFAQFFVDGDTGVLFDIENKNLSLFAMETDLKTELKTPYYQNKIVNYIHQRDPAAKTVVLLPLAVVLVSRLTKEQSQMAVVSNEDVSCVHLSVSGDWLLLGNRSGKLSRINTNSFAEQTTQTEVAVTCAVSNDGNIWFSTASGALYRWSTIDSMPKALPMTAVEKVATTSSNGVVARLSGGVVASLDVAGVEQSRTSAGRESTISYDPPWISQIRTNEYEVRDYLSGGKLQISTMQRPVQALIQEGQLVLRFASLTRDQGSHVKMYSIGTPSSSEEIASWVHQMSNAVVDLKDGDGATLVFPKRQ